MWHKGELLLAVAPDRVMVLLHSVMALSGWPQGQRLPLVPLATICCCSYIGNLFYALTALITLLLLNRGRPNSGIEIFDG